MATTQEIIGALVHEARFACVGEGLRAFKQYLEGRKGRDLTAIAPMEDVNRLTQELENPTDHSIWLRSFLAREDVRVAAGKLAVEVRRSGESARLAQAWDNRQEPEDIA